eukprot:1160087-Pelagomonas_calceolata.AAC.2
MPPAPTPVLLALCSSCSKLSGPPPPPLTGSCGCEVHQLFFRSRVALHPSTLPAAVSAATSSMLSSMGLHCGAQWMA